MERYRLKTLDRRRMQAYKPTWAGPIEAWTISFVNKQAWRTRPLHSADDLYQEAYLKFIRCVELYPRIVDAKHFMAMYMRCVQNLVNALAMLRTKAVVTPAAGGESMPVVPDTSSTRAAETRILLGDAPEAVDHLMSVFLGDEDDIFDLERINGRRETTREFVRRIAGIDLSNEDLQELQTFLSGA